ncbi:DUF3619 family protein [Pseudothauera nasutitermitis]|uniref:DUF3619 family protein n=1 Tax=Pseudothauera nasutitermitis TaxID=2565930 RepID=A0A4S4APC0_9RHOO|nr:DUF3619 family protein [Pseudothauera nasutitermitis]THF61493.1 DUF3619 family protein [Pseudothauera nasutitermitis]
MSPYEEVRRARRLAACLTCAARRVDGAAADRLCAARQRALAAQCPARGRFALRWPATSATPLWKPLCAAAAVLLLSMAGDYWGSAARVGEQRDVDFALLSDDLPIDAYLDTEFKAWLEHASRS